MARGSRRPRGAPSSPTWDPPPRRGEVPSLSSRAEPGPRRSILRPSVPGLEGPLEPLERLREAWDTPETLTTVSRVLAPGRARYAPSRARRGRGLLASLLRPVVSPRLERAAAVCRDRSIRRQVLFATGRSGKLGYRKLRRTWRSSYSCR